jgi:predicted RNase H-like HicB family nuclease
MRYPIAIERGTEAAAYGVVVPDLPGCFSAGDTLDETISSAEEAAAALDAGEAIPAPTEHGRAGRRSCLRRLDTGRCDGRSRATGRQDGADQYHPAAPRIVAPGWAGAGGGREPVG